MYWIAFIVALLIWLGSGATIAINHYNDKRRRRNELRRRIGWYSAS